MRINYITGRTSEFNEFRDSIPVHLEAGGFMLCTSGSGEVVVDSRQYSIKQWDLVVAFPHSYAHAIHTSEDFDGIIFGVDFDIVISTDIADKSFYITTIASNPCISLSQSEAQKIIMLQESFLQESKNLNHPFRNDIDESILKIIIYEVAALFRSSKPNIEHLISRDDAIFNNFVVQLHSEESYNRNLNYFASRQSITPSHLSKVIKRVSARTASAWISDHTILCIKRHLQNRDLQIATIAERLNFPNASFFTQYFKERTGQTPKEYRIEFFGTA